MPPASSLFIIYLSFFWQEPAPDFGLSRLFKSLEQDTFQYEKSANK